jgi:regulator of protease activity HflC (stomatin/prohibitin superfamily)
MAFIKLVLVLLGLAYLVYRVIKKDKDARYGIGIRSIGSLVSGALVFIVILILISSIGQVTTGHRGIVLRWSAATGKVLGQGIYIVTPVVEKVDLMSVQVKDYVTEAEAASRDIQDVRTKVTLNYSVSDKGAANLYIRVGRDYEKVIIKPAVQEAVKAATALYDAEQLIKERPKVKDQITTFLSDRLAAHDIIVDAVSITDFKFSDKFTAQVEEKVTAAQSALTAKNVLEQVTYEAQQKIKKAEADAKSIEIQANAIKAQGGKEYVMLQLIKQWDGKLPVTMLGNGTIPFLDVLKAIEK